MIKNKYVLMSFLAMSFAGTILQAMDERKRLKKALKKKQLCEKLFFFNVLNNNANEGRLQVDKVRTHLGQMPYVTTHMLRGAASLHVSLENLKHRNLTLEKELGGAVDRAILRHAQQRIPAENREKFILHAQKQYRHMLGGEQKDLRKIRTLQEVNNAHKILAQRQAILEAKELSDEFKAQGF